MNTQTQIQKDEKPPSGKWLLYIFGGASILVTLIIVFVFLVVWMPLKGYLSEKPFDIEYYPTSATDRQFIRKKLTSFLRGDSTDTLVLNSSDINNLVRGNSLLKEYDLKYRIDLRDSLFNLRCVVPASKIKNHMASIIKFVKVEGFINAEMEGLVLLNGNKLNLVTTRAQINSRPAPFTLLGSRSQIELNQFFPDPMVYRQFLEKVQDVYIRDGRLVIVRS